MEIGQMILLAFLLWVGWKMLKGFDKSDGKALFCTTCGHQGETKTQTKGSLAIEIVLWLCFIIPGIIYTIWRHSSRQGVCASCGGTALVPPDSPIAKATKKTLNIS